MPNKLKQTCIFQLLDCVSPYDLLLPSAIKVRGRNKGKMQMQMFFKSITDYLNVAYRREATKSFNSRCSKTTILAFWSTFENPLTPNLQKIIKALFKTSLKSGYFWCFISFTNSTFYWARWKFLTSGRYFNPLKC